MSNGTPILPLPLPEDDDQPTPQDLPTQEVDGEEIIDEDVDGDLVNSADADVISSTEGSAQERSS